MPRIPRAEAQLQPQIASMPNLVGEGWTAPGKAMQQLGQGIQKLGSAFAKLGEQQEAEQLHEAKIAALNLKNEWDLSEIEARANYTGDGTDYMENRSAEWASRLQDFQSKYSSAGPKVRRFVETFAASTTGQVNEGIARFGHGRRLDTLYAKTGEAALGEIAKLQSPEAMERYKTDPAQFEKDLEQAITVTENMVQSLPMDPDRKRALANSIANQFKAILGKALPEAALDALRKKIEEYGSSIRKMEFDKQTLGELSSKLVDRNGKIDPALFTVRMAQKIEQSPLNGRVPPWGPRYGITTGSPLEWAKFFAKVQQAESGHRIAKVNPDGTLQKFPTTPPGERSYGPGQFNIGEYGLRTWADVNNPERVMDAYIEVAKQGKLFSYFGPLLRGYNYSREERWFQKQVAPRLKNYLGMGEQAAAEMKKGDPREGSPAADAPEPVKIAKGKNVQTDARDPNEIPEARVAQIPSKQPGYVRSEILRDIMPLVPQLEARLKAETIKQIESVNDRALSGRLPSEEERALIERRVERINDPVLKMAWEDAKRRGEWTAGLRTMPPSVLGGIVMQGKADLAAKGGTEDAYKRIDALDKLHKRMLEGLDRNPYEWASESGVISDPVQISKGTFNPETLAKRAQEYEIVRRTYGREIPVLNPDEAKEIAEIMSVGGKPTIAAAGMIVESFGASAPKVFAQIAKDQPDLGHLGWLLLKKTRPGLVTEFSEAIAARKAMDEKIKSVISPEALEEYYYNKAGNFLKFVNRDERDRLLSAVGTLYAFRASRGGSKPDPKSPDAKILDRTFRDLIGENEHNGVTYGGLTTNTNGAYQRSNPVHLPSYLRQDGFYDAVQSLNNSDFGWTVFNPRAENEPVMSPEEAQRFAGKRAPEGQTTEAQGQVRPQEDGGVRKWAAPELTETMKSFANQANEAKWATDRAVQAAKGMTSLSAQPMELPPGWDPAASGNQPLDYMGKPLNWRSVVGRGTFVTIGDGKYWIALGDPTSDMPMWVLQSDGKPFVFDINKYESVLRDRKPDLFRPY